MGDFTSIGKYAFPYTQVMSCYRKVSISVAALRNTVQVVEQLAQNGAAQEGVVGLRVGAREEALFGREIPCG
jgi:hypothetical protein